MRRSRLALRWRVFASVAVVCLVALALSAPAMGDTYVGGAITIADSASPPTASSPYPSSVTVSGEQAIVTSVSVQIRGLTHQLPDELDLLLVGPTGLTVLLVSDAGATAETNETFTVSDGALGQLPPDSGLGGTFQPTDIDDGEADVFPTPAPAGPFGTSLSALAESGANGTWSLYAVDDTADDAGSIGSWELRISSRNRWRVGLRTEQLSPPFGFPEDSGSVRVLVERVGSPYLRPAGLSYATGPFHNDPTPGQDYIDQSGRFEWAAGETGTRTIDIPIIDDAIPEQQESILLTFGDPAGDLALPDNTYSIIISIADNDPPPALLPVLGGRRVQRVLKQRGVIVTAKSNVAGTVTATGTIAVPRGAAAIVRLKKVQRRVTAGQTVKLKLGLSKKALRALRQALTTRRKLRVTVRLSLKDTLGRTKTTSRKLTVKP
jgi:subtilisin-like proprotein convertase family protein